MAPTDSAFPRTRALTSYPHPDAFSCTVSFGDGEAVVHLAGELELATASHFTESATPLAGAWATVALDLGELTFCDSSGVNAFLQLRRRCERAGTNVVLRSPTATVLRVLQLARVNDVFRVEP